MNVVNSPVAPRTPISWVMGSSVRPRAVAKWKRVQRKQERARLQTNMRQTILRAMVDEKETREEDARLEREVVFRELMVRMRKASRRAQTERVVALKAMHVQECDVSDTGPATARHAVYAQVGDQYLVVASCAAEECEDLAF